MGVGERGDVRGAEEQPVAVVLRLERVEVREPAPGLRLPGPGDGPAVGGPHLVAAPHGLGLGDQGRVDGVAGVLPLRGVQQHAQAAAGGEVAGQVVVGEQAGREPGGSGVEDDERGARQRRRRPARQDGYEDPRPGDGDPDPVLQHVHPDEVDAVGGGQREVGHGGRDAEGGRLPGAEVRLVQGVEVLELAGVVAEPAPDRRVRRRGEGGVEPLRVRDRCLVAPEARLGPDDRVLAGVGDAALQGDRPVARREGRADRGEGDGGQRRGLRRLRRPRAGDAEQHGQARGEREHERQDEGGDQAGDQLARGARRGAGTRPRVRPDGPRGRACTPGPSRHPRRRRSPPTRPRPPPGSASELSGVVGARPRAVAPVESMAVPTTRPADAAAPGDASDALDAVQRDALSELLRLTPLVDRLGELFVAAGHELYLVGGSVRDALLGRLGSGGVKDLDFTTSARPDDVEALLRRFSPAVWTIGKEFGTVGCRVVDDGVDWVVEVTTFRADAYGSDSRKPAVVFGDTVEGDLLRRDFTVNAMAVELPSRRFVDPYAGLRHLARKILMTPAEPESPSATTPCG